MYYTRELSHLSIYLMVLWLMPWKLFANAQVQSPFIFLLYPQLRTITFDYVSCWSQWAGTVLQTMAKGYVYKHKIMIQRRGADGATIFTSRWWINEPRDLLFGEASGVFHFLHFLFSMLTPISRVLDDSFLVHLNGYYFYQLVHVFLSICTLTIIFFFCSSNWFVDGTRESLKKCLLIKDWIVFSL